LVGVRLEVGAGLEVGARLEVGVADEAVGGTLGLAVGGAVEVQPTTSRSKKIAVVGLRNMLVSLPVERITSS
jgi:hypothetical protein